MYTFPALRGRKKLSKLKYILYLSMLRYYVLLISINWLPLQNDWRWLLRRGSPLPIPNREVKPACADGTAICGRVCRRLFSGKPVLTNRLSCFYTWSPLGFLLLISNVAFLRNTSASELAKQTRCENNGFFVLFKVQHSLFNIQNFKRTTVYNNIFLSQSR